MTSIFICKIKTPKKLNNLQEGVKVPAAVPRPWLIFPLIASDDHQLGFYFPYMAI